MPPPDWWPPGLPPTSAPDSRWPTSPSPVARRPRRWTGSSGFRSLAPGVAEVEFLRADVAVQTEFAPFQPGFIRRTTARGERENTWLVLTLWRDAETAREASDAMVSDPV